MLTTTYCGDPKDTDELWQRVQHTAQDVPQGFFVLGDTSTNYLLVAMDRITAIEYSKLW
jgi:hypothetical protein